MGSGPGKPSLRQSLDPVPETAEQRRHILLRGRRPVQVDLEGDVVSQLLGEHLEGRAPPERGRELLRVVVVANTQAVIGGALRRLVEPVCGGRDLLLVEPAVGADEGIDEDVESQGLGRLVDILLRQDGPDGPPNAQLIGQESRMPGLGPRGRGG